VAESGEISTHVNRFCKFQLAFLQPVEAKLFSSLPVVSMEQNGRFVRLVLEGESLVIKQALEALNPVIIEEMPMDFEEIFIHEVEKRGNKI
jgi:ABC-2 type transport system ATP-binding protein